MESEFLLGQHGLFVVNLLNVKGLAIHVNDELLVGVDLVLLKGTYSNYDLDAIALTGHLQLTLTERLFK